MARVLIVSANRERVPDPVFPLGPAAVAAAVRGAGHDVRAFDACFATDSAAPEGGPALEPAIERRLGAELGGFEPDVVGLSLRNVDNTAYPLTRSYLPEQVQLARVLRRMFPSAALVLGGSAFSLFPAAYLAVLGADYGVSGEGEHALPQLLESLRAGGRSARRPPAPRLIEAPRVADLDGLPEPAFDLFDVERYYQDGGSINVQTKRGCAFRCEYCTYPALEGKAMRLWKPERVVERIERLFTERGIAHFFFVDSVFNQPSAHAAAIAARLAARRLAIRFTAYLSPRGCTKELLEALARAGCTSVEFGTDALSDPQLGRLGKGFSARQALEASRWCREIGLKFAHALILGGTGETPETLRETLAHALDSGATAIFATVGERVYPGTPLARRLAAAAREPAPLGIEPVFHVSAAVKDEVVPLLEQVARANAGWVVPGLGIGVNPRLLARARSRGSRGPIWERLAAPASGGAS